LSDEKKSLPPAGKKKSSKSEKKVKRNPKLGRTKASAGPGKGGKKNSADHEITGGKTCPSAKKTTREKVGIVEEKKVWPRANPNERCPEEKRTNLTQKQLLGTAIVGRRGKPGVGSLQPKGGA